MGANESSGHIIEPEKQVPIVYNVDVAVIGAGIAGLFYSARSRKTRGQRLS